jgi:multidrug efflux system membrane fusion protein
MVQNEANLSEQKTNAAGEPRPRRFVAWVLIFGAAVAAAAFFYLPRGKSSTAEAKSTGDAPSGKAKKKGSGAVQVVAADVRKGDIGIYINGLGAVTPIYTVTVRSRVDGELMNIRFAEGQMVSKGDLLVEIDPRPYKVQLSLAQAQLSRDQALLKNTKLDLERYRTLIKQNAIAEQQLSTQEALLAQYEATIQGDQAAVDSARLNLEYCQIRSPITGLVGLRLVDPGNIVHAADSGGMLTITQIDPISVIFTAPEDQIQPVLQRLRAGQHLPVEAWDRDLKKRLSAGRLETIDNQIDPSTGTFRLRAVFGNRDGALFPSQFVNAKMLVEKSTNVTLVPTVAIQRNAQNTYVWLVNPADQTVSVREVALLTSEGDDTGVASGLEPGDKVVTVGVDRLRVGSKVSLEGPKAKAKKKAT